MSSAPRSARQSRSANSVVDALHEECCRHRTHKTQKRAQLNHTPTAPRHTFSVIGGRTRPASDLHVRSIPGLHGTQTRLHPSASHHRDRDDALSNNPSVTSVKIKSVNHCSGEITRFDKALRRRALRHPHLLASYIRWKRALLVALRQREQCTIACTTEHL